MGNMLARLFGDGLSAAEKASPFPVQEFMTLIALVCLFVTFFCLIVYGTFKACRNGTCNNPVESGG